MTEQERLAQNYRELKSFETYMKQMGFFTKVYAVSENMPIPMVTLLLEKDYKGDFLTMSAAFTPFSPEEMEKSRLLQLSVELNTEVAQKKEIDILKFANLVNGVLPVGQFVILSEKICYRYALALSDTQAITDAACLEVITLFSLLSVEYEKIFSKLAIGRISLQETCETFQKNSRL